MVRYIHASDLHLDSPFKGLKNIPKDLLAKIKDSTFNSLRNIVEAAIKHKVDFVLIAGDIYDIEDRSIRAQVLLQKEFERLNDMNIKVYLIHGNHDYINNSEMHLALPDNVKTFGPQVETVIHDTISQETIAISGFSYDKTWINERKITDYPSRNLSADFHIGLLHGFMEGQNTAHARYAPFSITELKDKNYDYWALGHIHKRQQLGQDPLIYYSGNTQGRHKNEEGDKGCLLVELTASTHSVTFIPTADITWQTLSIDVRPHQHINEIFEKVKHELNKPTYENCLINLKLLVSDDTSMTVFKKLTDDDFYQPLHRLEPSSFLYIVSQDVSVNSEDSQRLSLESSFPEAWEKALKEIEREETFQTVTQDLFSMHAYSKFSEDAGEDYRNETIISAKRMLLQDLGDEISYDN